MTSCRWGAAARLFPLLAGSAYAQMQDPAAGLCEALASSVRDADLGTSGFIASWRAASDEDKVPAPLANAAFIYDQSLAVVALVGCGDLNEAKILGRAILSAARSDRTYADGRLRNAYRAGPSATPVLLPGWWDADRNTWGEDAYQVSTATGNVAWAALALLRLYEADSDPRWREGAERLVRWIGDHTVDERAPAGFAGGFAGFDGEPKRVRWKSTEHNIDVMASAAWLAALPDADPRFAEIAAMARSFVEAMELPGGGFLIGTTPESSLGDARQLVLDVQLWPILALRDPPPSWFRALDIAGERLSVDGGFDFNTDRDSVWTEGTAQAALTFLVAGRAEQSAAALERVLRVRTSGSWLSATSGGTVTTGLAVGPEGEADFLYYPRPHLGATAWAALAATGTNPFLPRGTDK